MTKLLRAQGEAGWDKTAALKRTVAGTAAALGSMLVLTVALVPLRHSLTVATSALILIVPVVIGVVVGGFPAGVISVIIGFLVYDVFFIPPYLTWAVGAPQNWAALGVYLVVMVPVAMVVAGMNSARAKERRLGTELRELFAVSALLLARAGRLEVAAAAGEPLSAEQLRQIAPPPGTVEGAGGPADPPGDLLLLALTAAGRPVGLLT